MEQIFSYMCYGLRNPLTVINSEITGLIIDVIEPNLGVFPIVFTTIDGKVDIINDGHSEDETLFHINCYITMH